MGKGSRTLTRRWWTLKEKSRRPSISTLNRDGGYELPAIFNHLLSRDNTECSLLIKMCVIQSKATVPKNQRPFETIIYFSKILKYCDGFILYGTK